MVARLLSWFLAVLKRIFPFLFHDKGIKGCSSSIKPIFESSFVQYWYAQDWSIDRWEQELTMLKDIGITEIILQSIADTKTRYAVYFTNISGFSHNSVNMVETVLTAADKLGMKVRIGLGFSDDWWRKFSDKSWLNSEAAVNKAIAGEIADKFGEFASFSGWYIPHEFYQFTALTKKRQLYLNSFFKAIASEIKNKLLKDIMIAPFYYGKFRWLVPLRFWPGMLKNILKDTGIDIVALQDSIGAGFNSLRQLSRIFSYTREALDTLGMKFYVDVETFTSTFSGNISAPQSRIEEQITEARPYAHGFIAFSIDHYQNRNEANQINYYNDYYRYYVKNR